jgi:hypothetical protein
MGTDMGSVTGHPPDIWKKNIVQEKKDIYYA